MSPVLLDLFCGAGGAAVGYHRAGFTVIGTDIKPQPHYPFKFIQGDALEVLATMYCDDVDAIHASPPCQAFTRARTLSSKSHEDLLTPTRELLVDAGLPWVIENVPGAPMRPDYVLCGTNFGLKTRRHRWFEMSWGPLAALYSPCVDHKEAPVQVFGHAGGAKESARGDMRWSKAEWAEAMGIDWMTSSELAQAIPPAYTEYIGSQLMKHISARV